MFSYGRHPAAVYLGFLQSLTAKTAVLLGHFLDIFVSVRKNLRDTTLMNVFLRAAASRRCVTALDDSGGVHHKGTPFGRLRCQLRYRSRPLVEHTTVDYTTQPTVSW